MNNTNNNNIKNLATSTRGDYSSYNYDYQQPSVCFGSLLIPSSDLQEFSEYLSHRPVTVSKRRTTDIGAFLADNVNDPKAHPYAKRKGTN